MKKISVLLCAFFAFTAFVGCSAGYDAREASNSPTPSQDNVVSAEPTSAPAQSQETGVPEGCEEPLVFDSEEQFLSFMSELRSGNPDRELTVSSIHSDYDRVYRASNDYFEFVGLTEVYAPGTELPGTHLGYISASKYTVSFVYFNEDEEKVAYLMWHRSLPPESIYPDGGSRTEYNGVEYAVEEYGPIEEDSYPGGYWISWASDNKAFHAEVLVGFTMEEMMAFCDYKPVPLK